MGQSPSNGTGVGMVRQAPGERYRAGGLHRMLLGKEYRELWVTPVDVPVLDLERFAGGLKVLGRTGGQETRTLKLGAADGRQFFFRSIDKNPAAALPPELRGTVAGRVLQDQISSALPLGPLVVAPLLEAAGIPHTDPQLMLIPDVAALGEFRAEFAGVLGFLEDRVGGSGPAGNWHGASEIIDSDTLFARAQRSNDDRVDARTLLAARLFDVFIGDWDRHRDQWRWIRFGDTLPRSWRPVPLDRDQAFVKYDGLLLGVARQTAPQLVNFGPHYAYMAGQTWNGRELDRRFLTVLERPAWDSVAGALRAALSDSVIHAAVTTLPPEERTLIGAWLERALRQRRDGLPEAARRFYLLLARQVDLHGTDGPDRATLDRAADGSVTVRLGPAASGDPTVTRRFLPGETSEVRLFLGPGDDAAVVRGGGGGITLRILGDSGADQLVDSSTTGGTRFYDADPRPEVTTGHRTSIDRRSYTTPPNPNPRALPPRDWGSRWQPNTWASFGPDIGLFIGGGRTLTIYGFRKYPYASRHRFRAGVATGPPTYRVDYLGEFRRENSRAAVTFAARASGIEVIRFNGFGNETSVPGNNAYYRVTQNQVTVEPAVRLPLGSRLTMDLGPTLKFVSTDRRADRFLATLNPYGTGKFGELGFRAGLELDTRNRRTAASTGVLLSVTGAVHPAWWDVRKRFGEVSGEALFFLSPPWPLDPTLSFRAGGKKLWGDYPYFDAAFIGGSSTVRLGRENRYAGDAAAFGSAELRLALARTVLVVPADIGVFGLADAGRVYLRGETSHTWHTAFGGGLWASFLSRANTVSAAVAASREHTRLYLQAGFGF
jgi:hypothetical protein